MFPTTQGNKASIHAGITTSNKNHHYHYNSNGT